MMVTVSRNTVYSVFFLILVFISISILFIMIGAEFLGMIMLIVYVGAVSVLFLFVVMMLNVAQQKNEWFVSTENSSHIPVGLLISLIIFFELIIVIGGWKFKPDLIFVYEPSPITVGIPAILIGKLRIDDSSLIVPLSERVTFAFFCK